jgi:hypothetical protein
MRDLTDKTCFAKAQERGDQTFTVVGRDMSSPRVICEWIKENIETCPEDKLHEALNRAIVMRSLASRRRAD